MTVLDAVLEAGGGETIFAAPNRSSVPQGEGQRWMCSRSSFGNILTKGQLQTNVPLRAGDVITVPERFLTADRLRPEFATPGVHTMQLLPEQIAKALVNEIFQFAQNGVFNSSP